MHHSLSRVNELLGDIVEEVPAAEGKGALQEGQGQVTHRRCHPEVKGIAGPQLLKVSWGSRGQGSVSSPQPGAQPHPGPTLEHLDKAHADDERQGQQLPAGEDVLDAGGPAHAGAVHPGQKHWGGKWREGVGGRLRPQPPVGTATSSLSCPREDGIPGSGQSASCTLRPTSPGWQLEGSPVLPCRAGRRGQPSPVGTHSGRPGRACGRPRRGGCSWGTQAAARSWRRSWR